MNNLIKITVWGVMAVLVTANIFLFVSTIGLTDEIGTFEKKTKELHMENLKLEKEASFLSSLKFAASAAEELDFTKKSTPQFLDKLGVALNK